MKKNKKILWFICLFGLIFVTSLASAATAKLNWQANTESDLAGYKVYWGSSPRTGTSAPGGYANSQDVGNVTEYTASNIADQGATYFSVTAYDTSQNESGFSNEDRKTPGDINKDRTVNMIDFGQLVTNYGNSSCDNVADINLDCSVNMLDFGALVGNYGFSAS